MRSWWNRQTRCFEGAVLTRRMSSSLIDRTNKKIQARGFVPALLTFMKKFYFLCVICCFLMMSETSCKEMNAVLSIS